MKTLFIFVALAALGLVATIVTMSMPAIAEVPKNCMRNPHDNGELGNPHDDGDTGNPHNSEGPHGLPCPGGN
jgi:hypothetical protein